MATCKKCGMANCRCKAMTSAKKGLPKAFPKGKGKGGY